MWVVGGGDAGGVGKGQGPSHPLHIRKGAPCQLSEHTGSDKSAGGGANLSIDPQDGCPLPHMME